MKILVTGASGFLATRLIGRLLEDDAPLAALGGKVGRIHALSRRPPEIRDDRVEPVAEDFTTSERLPALIAEADLVFHLAAVVSAEAETDFDKGYAVNVDGTRRLLEACRARAAAGRPVRLVFSSSAAVYGGPLPPLVPDDHHLTPQTSYGAQKAIGELLVADYTRKGFVDGRSGRIGMVIVRPGANKAASGFASAIIREPLEGHDYVCPVPPETRIWVNTIDVVVENLIRLAALDGNALGPVRSVVLPGMAATVGDLHAALAAFDAEAARRVRFEPDPAVMAIASGWPGGPVGERARRLGLLDESGVDQAIARYARQAKGQT